MSKQQTPIQQAIADLETKIAYLRGRTDKFDDKKVWSYKDKEYRDFIRENAMLHGFESARMSLITFLPIEKKFAQDTFNAGFEFHAEIPQNSGIVDNPRCINFSDFFKQYKDE